MRRLFPFVTLCAALAAAFVLASSAGAAQNNHLFLCYSQWQVDPGSWSLGPANAFGGVTTAQSLLAAGYWTPVAETSIPTATKVGSYYLYCNGSQTGMAALTPDGMNFVDNNGKLLGAAAAARTGGQIYALAS